LIDRIESQRKVRGKHSGCVTFFRIACIWNGACSGAILWFPLLCACGTLGEVPFKAKQVFKKGAAPFGRCSCPGAFQSTGNCICAVSFSKCIFPAKALFFDSGGSRFCAYILLRIGSAVCFTEAVSSGNKGNGFFVVHGHATERFPYIAGSGNWVRFSVGAFRIYIDKTHLHSTQRIFQLTVTGVAVVGKPLGFRSPVYIFLWFPCIFTSTCKAKGLEAHRLEGAIASKDQQVCP